MKITFGLILCVFLLPFKAIGAEAELAVEFETTNYVLEVDGQKLDGLFDSPIDRDATATIILVHGYGETNVVAQNWFYDLRSRFARIGINTLVWDKPGCGSSEGTFNSNQSVESSAKEVAVAVQSLRESGAAGTEKIGLWGISRAGWIAPLAMDQDPSIAFWISVSGTDDKENFRYLLESNLLIEGRSEEQTQLLVDEWQARFNLTWQGGSFEESLKAGLNLDQDPFMKYLSGGDDELVDHDIARKNFIEYQRKFETGELLVDEEAELMIYVPEFEGILRKIEKPVLAIFGEKDTVVDWRKTSKLYNETIGLNPAASLVVKTFPNADHNIRQSNTGGIRERGPSDPWPPFANGYYDSMLDWLIDLGFGAQPLAKTARGN